jgi:hypothetical protein
MWSVEELHEHWSVSPSERDLLFRREHVSRLGFIAQLAFYRLRAGFPEHRNEFAPIVIAHLAEQLGVEAATLDEYDWNGRTGRRHRDAILEFLGVRPFDDAAEEAFRTWLMTTALPKEPNADTLDEWITTWLLQSKIDRPGGDYRFERIVRWTKHAYDERVFADVLARLDAGRECASGLTTSSRTTRSSRYARIQAASGSRVCWERSRSCSACARSRYRPAS